MRARNRAHGVVVIVREARAADVAFLAGVILAAGRSHVSTSFWDLFLGRPGDGPVKALLERLVRSPHRSWWHRDQFLVVEEDGEPAAALSGFFPHDPGVRSPESALVQAVREIGFDDADTRRAFARAAPFFTCTMEPERDAWLVENVATRPQSRRRGHVAKLLPRILEQGRRRGFRRAQLTLFLGNVAAERAYEREGFRVVAERRHPDFEAAVGCPGLARMECPL
ncbi:hypothetical protein MYXO_01289 [Myxococcaceae bacterium]|jgi:ribosomal protein S18 acetylase RimI-like enzyme|nr:hypothetical protein MYXO_01289 [Myxococcaceae bacterium]